MRLRGWDADDLGVIGAGAVYLGLASFTWYENRAVGIQWRAWDAGLLAILAVLLAAYAAGRVALLHWRPMRPDVPLSPAAEPFAAAVAALLLTAYRILDVPNGMQRTNVLAFVGVAVVAQVAFAARKVSRTGFRAPPT